MTDELKFRDKDSLDERTLRAIHDAYMPPIAKGESENSYWNALERQIMSRIESAGPRLREQTWMSVLNGWAQVGLVAAAALFAIGSAMADRLGEPAEQVAYDSVVQVSPEGIATTSDLINATDKPTLHEAALRYVYSY